MVVASIYETHIVYMEEEDKNRNKNRNENRKKPRSLGFLSGFDGYVGFADTQMRIPIYRYIFRSGTFSDIVVSGYITFRYGCCALPCERSVQTERKIPRWRCIFVSDRYSNLFIITFCGWLFVLFHVVAISVCSCFALLRISWFFDRTQLHNISLNYLVFFFFFCLFVLSRHTQNDGMCNVADAWCSQVNVRAN